MKQKSLGGVPQVRRNQRLYMLSAPFPLAMMRTGIPGHDKCKQGNAEDGEQFMPYLVHHSQMLLTRKLPPAHVWEQDVHVNEQPEHGLRGFGPQHTAEPCLRDPTMASLLERIECGPYGILLDGGLVPESRCQELGEFNRTRLV